MRYALLADIHANMEAFTAVLADIERRGGVDEFWCLGDIVGYGPDPSDCIQLLRQQPHVCVSGNHDLAAIGRVDALRFNPDAAFAIRWTQQQLNREDIEYLESLPRVISRGDFTMVHGSPREPIWEYLVSSGSAGESFSHFKTKFCLVGHSHRPLMFRQNKDGGCSFIPLSISIGQVLRGNRAIFNPGGIGQPRDGDLRASYAIYDNESSVVRLYRVAYDINTTQQKMTEANLPVKLIVRLEQGL
jgi:predicted phosphodiesterase